MSYYLNRSLRERTIQFAEGEYASAGEFFNWVMRTYLNADYGSLTERLVNRLERIEPVGGKVVQSRDPVERRTETIADGLRGRESFDTDDLDAAVAEANRVDAGRYAVRKCLPRVLNEIEFIWAPEDTPRCVDTETVPATRDIRQKPYILVYETDRKLGFKTDAVAGYRTEKSYTVEDGPDTLNSWPQPKTAWRLFRKIVAEETGLSTEMALKTSLLSTRANRRTIDSNSLRRS